MLDHFSTDSPLGRTVARAVELLSGGAVMTRLQAIENEALALEPEERAALVETLQASLDTPEEIDAAWAEEIERRSVDFKRGAVQGIPAEIVLAEARALLK